MKKLLTIFLSLTLIFSLTACSGGLDLNPNSGNSDGYQEGGAEGHIGDTMHTYWFDFTVDEAYATQEYEGYTAQDGYRLIVVTITAKNTFDKSVPMWDTDFVIEWQDENSEYMYEVPLPAYTDGQFPEEYELAVNESATYVAVYEVPVVDSLDYDIGFMEYFDTDNPDDEEGDVYFVYFTAEER